MCGNNTNKSTISTVINTTGAMTVCYDRHDNQVTGYYPCSPDGDLSLAQCCSPGDSCASNGLCVGSSADDSLTPYFIDGCTVAGWVTNETARPATCLAECVGLGVGVKVCGTGTFCCYGYTDCDCSDSSVVFTLAAVEIVTSIAADIASSSSLSSSTTSSVLSTEGVGTLVSNTSPSTTSTDLPSTILAYTSLSSATTLSISVNPSSLSYLTLATDTELPKYIPASTASSSSRITATVSPSPSASANNSSSQPSAALGAGIGIAIGITLMAIFFAAFCISRRRRLQQQQEGRQWQEKRRRARSAAAELVASLHHQQHQKNQQRKLVVELQELGSEEKYELYAPGQVYFPSELP